MPVIDCLSIAGGAECSFNVDVSNIVINLFGSALVTLNLHQRLSFQAVQRHTVCDCKAAIYGR